MHLGFLNSEVDEISNAKKTSSRRNFIKTAGAMISVAGLAPSAAFAGNKKQGFNGSGRMGMSTGEDWIDTFYTGGAEAIVHYYADDFVFEDITLFQTIQDKDELYRAFLPFGKGSPAGEHQFDVLRYDGGMAGDRTAQLRMENPGGYSDADWHHWSKDTFLGADHSYDEWCVMQWIWRGKHNVDFLGLPAIGKTTTTRGITFHCYQNRKIVRESTFWNYRDVAIQLGAAPAPNKFWLKK
ncbi:twin-arginine translocation signal domain-containing protein [Zhongshania sp.]|uniref:twin-arginine translocation signal domain-containing protein n=1 Tax=Zhongshania sp. TaxID=1971902 RepID=UPI0035666E5E